jgi:phage shock protein PspC (stress-responsive transcriptional regulator)
MFQQNINNLKNFFEANAFGACAYLGDKLGISTSKIRLAFIYTSFLTVGSPILVYFTIVFWMDLKNYFRRKSLIGD